MKKIVLFVLFLGLLRLGYVIGLRNTDYESSNPSFHLTYPKLWIETARNESFGPSTRLLCVQNLIESRLFIVDKLHPTTTLKNTMYIDPQFTDINPITAAMFSDYETGGEGKQFIRAGRTTYAGKDMIEFIYLNQPDGFARILAPLTSTGLGLLTITEGATSVEGLDSSGFKSIEKSWTWN